MTGGKWACALAATALMSLPGCIDDATREGPCAHVNGTVSDHLACERGAEIAGGAGATEATAQAACNQRYDATAYCRETRLQAWPCAPEVSLARLAAACREGARQFFLRR